MIPGVFHFPTDSAQLPVLDKIWTNSPSTTNIDQPESGASPTLLKCVVSPPFISRRIR